MPQAPREVTRKETCIDGNDLFEYQVERCPVRLEKAHENFVAA